MKIRPVILCGGSGTRLWPDQKHHQPKQFIDFGNWTLFGKTLERIKDSIFDYPIISTNKKYISEIKKQYNLKKYILLFPFCSPHLSVKKWPYFDKLIELIKDKFETDYKVIIAPGPKEIDEAKKFDAKIILIR